MDTPNAAALVESATSPPAPEESPADTISRVCRERSITLDTLIGRNTTRWVTDARRDVAFALYARGMSQAMIGQILGGRDHTTIMTLLGRKGSRS